MGLGHVSAGSVPSERNRPHVSGRQHRGTGARRPDLITLGRTGEWIAARFLEGQGARVLARNLFVSGGELDLLVSFGRERAAVEVKAGTQDPSWSLTDTKVQHVRELAAQLQPPVFRIDLVAVTMALEAVTVRWIPRAT